MRGETSATRGPSARKEPGVPVTVDARVEAVPAASPGELDERWALVLPHQERLRRIASRRLACKDEVDDVVQEAMLRAVTFERLDPAYAGQFLTTVTVRLCADVQRDRARQLRVGVRDALRTVEPGEPHDTLLDQEEARWLYGECLKLPARECAVVLARASGMSVKETATKLGVGTKSAEAALTKARHRMRRVAQSAGITVLGLLKRVRYAGTPAAVAAGVTAATVGGMVGGFVLDHPERRAPKAPVAAAPAVPFRAATVTVPQADPAGTVVSVARKPVAPAPAAKPQETTGRTGGRERAPEIDTPPVGDPGLVGTDEGIKGREEREDESFEESLVKCVSEVLTIDPDSPLCDAEA